jgi:YD repeat-containing protein
MTNWVIDGFGRPTQTQECTASASQGQQCTGQWLIGNENWDAANNLVSSVDARGSETDYVYDANGNLVAVGEPQVTTSEGRFRPTLLYDYDSSNNVVAFCDETQTHRAAADWVAAPSPSDSLCSSAAANVPHLRLTYAYPASEPAGELVSVVSALGYSRQVSYDPAQQGGSDFGLPTAVTGDTFTQTDGTSVTPKRSSWYDATGNLRCYSVGSGIWQFAYDSLGRVTSSADPDDSSANASSACGKTSGQAGWNTQTTATYFPDGSRQSEQTPSERAVGVSSTFTYDPDGDVTSETAHHGCVSGVCSAGVTKKWYDGADRLVEVAEPHDANDYYPSQWLTKYLYDISGSSNSSRFSSMYFSAYGGLFATVEWVQMPGGTTAGWAEMNGQAYDALDRVTKEYSYVPGTNGQLNTTTRTYDGLSSPGLLTTTTDALGQVTTYSYDERGATVSLSYAGDGGVTPPKVYGYDPNGRATSVQNASYGVRSSHYDLEGRLVEVDEPGSGYLSSPARIGYDYYPNGKRKDVTVSSSLLNANPLVRYAYRTDGLRSSSVLAYGGATYAFQSAYTDAGRPLSRNDPHTGTAIPGAGRTYVPTAWTYDTAGQLASQTMPAGFSYALISHDAEGASTGWRVSLGPGSDVVTSLTYNVRGENVKLVNHPTSPNWTSGDITPIDVRSANGAIIESGNHDVTSVDANNGVLVGWSDTAQGVTSDGFYYNCPTTNHNTNIYDSAARLITHSYNVFLDSSCGQNQDSVSTDGTHTWSYDADNHTTEQNGSTACIAWGPDGHADANRCPGTGGVDTLHYDGEDILFVTNTNGALSDIRLGTLGDLQFSTSGNVFRVEDRDGAGLAVTAHSSLGSDAIELGSQSSWSTTHCSGGNSIVDPPPFCQQLFGGHSMTLSVGGYGSSGAVPPYEQKQIDGIKWSDDVTLQGARAKADATGTWTTPDQYAGNVDDPLTQKSFMWNRNNPYEYSDPSGFCSVAGPTVVTVDGKPVTLSGMGCVDAKPVPPSEQLMPNGETVAQSVARTRLMADGLGFLMMNVPLGPEEGTIAAGGRWLLKRNLINAGVRPVGKQVAHHIVAFSAKKARPAQAILAKFHIDLNDPINGMFIDKIGSHPDLYYDKVNDIMAQATSEDEARALLEQIANQIRNGTIKP